MTSSYMEGLKIQIQKEGKNLLYSNFCNILEILVELKGYILSIYGFELKKNLKNKIFDFLIYILQIY